MKVTLWRYYYVMMKFLVFILFALTLFVFNLRCDLQDISRKDESDLSQASSNRGMSLWVK